MELQTAKFKSFHLMNGFNCSQDIFECNTKLVFFCSGSDFFVSVCVNVGIYTYGNGSNSIHARRNFVYNLYFLYALNVQTVYAVFNGNFNFFVSLSNTGKNNLNGIETVVHGFFNLSTTHTIRSKVV